MFTQPPPVCIFGYREIWSFWTKHLLEKTMGKTYNLTRRDTKTRKNIFCSSADLGQFGLKMYIRLPKTTPVKVKLKTKGALDTYYHLTGRVIKSELSHSLPPQTRTHNGVRMIAQRGFQGNRLPTLQQTQVLDTQSRM